MFLNLGPSNKTFSTQKDPLWKKPKLETDILYDATFWEECNFAQKTQQQPHSPTIPPDLLTAMASLKLRASNSGKEPNLGVVAPGGSGWLVEAIAIIETKMQTIWRTLRSPV